MGLVTWWRARQAAEKKDRDDYAQWCKSEGLKRHRLVVSIDGADDLHVTDIRCEGFPEYGQTTKRQLWSSSYRVALYKANSIVRNGIHDGMRVYPAHRIVSIEIQDVTLSTVLDRSQGGEMTHDEKPGDRIGKPTGAELRGQANPNDTATTRTVTRYWIHVDHPSCGYECCGGGKIEACEDDTEDGIWMKAEDVAPLLSQLAQQDKEIARLEVKAAAYDDINRRGDDAHAYAQAHLMPEAWGRNVWHAILDAVSALTARAEAAEAALAAATSPPTPH